MVCQDLVVKLDFVFVFVNALKGVFRIHSRGRFVASSGANLVQLCRLNTLQKHFFTLIHGKEEVLEGFVDVVAVGVLDYSATIFHNEMVNEGSGDVLDKIVVRMSACYF